MLVVDDYDLLVGSMGSPLAPLAEVVAQAATVGLHVLCARRVAGSQRTSFEPFSQRLRELRPTTLVLSGSPDEGLVAGSVKPQQLPPGRGWWVTPGGRAQLVQCCLPVARRCVPLEVDPLGPSVGTAAGADATVHRRSGEARK